MHIPGAEIRVVQAVRQFLGKFSEGKQAHERQLRDSMMVDARDFSTGVRQAIMGVKNAVTLPARQLSDVSVVWKALPEVERLVNEANARLARVHLDFGPDTTVGKAAESAIEELEAAAEVLRPGITDLEGAAEHAKRAEQHLRDFNTAAGKSIREPHAP